MGLLEIRDTYLRRSILLQLNLCGVDVLASFLCYLLGTCNQHQQVVPKKGEVCRYGQEKNFKALAEVGISKIGTEPWWDCAMI